MVMKTSNLVIDRVNKQSFNEAKNIVKKLIIISAYAVLLTACGGGSAGNNNNHAPDDNSPSQQPVVTITATEVNLDSTLPRYIQTYGSNLYIKQQESSISLFLLNGLNSSISQPFHNMANTPLPFLPVVNITDYKAKNFAFSYSPTLLDPSKKSEDIAEAWLAYDIKSDNLGNLNAKWLAAKFYDTDRYDFQTKFHAVGEYAVAAFNERKSDNKLNSDLVFAKFASIESPVNSTWNTKEFMTKCAAKSEDLISTTATTTNVGGIKNNDYVIVGSRGGAVCIYGLPSAKYPGWHDLANSAIQNGSYKRNFITSVQFNSMDHNNLYGYWTNIDINTGDINILRAKINPRNWAVEFTNITDATKIKNRPETELLDHRSLFVDPQNNVFIGSSDTFNREPTLARVYALPSNSDTWQKINLAKDDYGIVVSMSLAADGATPIVGTKYTNDDRRLVERAYYLNIQKQ
jgi:hypothetical protein